MSVPRFLKLHPIVGARDMERALRFYVEQLGFEIAFRDDANPTNYAGLRRDDITLHMQFQYEHEMSTIRLRFLVDDPDAPYQEYLASQAIAAERKLADTSWGTREFSLYDPDGNSLAFYRNL